MRLSKIIFVGIFLVFTNFLTAQELIESTLLKEFEKEYDNHISSAIFTSDGYYMVTGYPK